MSAVVGIDLGTTNTVIASVQGGIAATLGNERGEKLIPSAVSFHPNGAVLVGREAKARRLVDPKNTVYSIKRLIGRSFDSDEVSKARARSAFELRDGPGHAPLVAARSKTYTLPEISAFVLQEAKRVGERALGQPIERAVITVPANFNDLQRAATKIAGRVAGIEVMRILNEPTAAALAYGFGKANSERIAIYDFGGGTFDVTLLDLAGNVFEVLATAGDTFLGGDDVDMAIAERMAEQFLTAHRYDPRSDPQVFEHLLVAAERIKMQVASSGELGTVQLKDFVYGPGGASLDLTFTLSPEQLSQIAMPLVERTLQVCNHALSIAHLNSSSFDQVILVGGSTRIPLVRERVTQFFGRKPLDKLSPDEVVALGAAIQAAALTGAERRHSLRPAPKPPALPEQGPGRAAPALSRTPAAPPAVPIAVPVPPVSLPKFDDEPTAVNLPLLSFDDDEPPIEVVSPSELPAARGPGGTFLDNSSDALHEAVMAAAGVAVAAAGSDRIPEGSTTLKMGSVPPVPVPPVPPVPMASTPLLIDVTPLSLSVETVGGYCDVIIERNTPVPCERTRVFTTAADNQTVVHVNVAQGESLMFRDNVALGQLELAGLRAAPRGQVQVAVTFEMDTDGILGIRAKDPTTGQSTAARVRLGSMPDAAEIDAMQARVQGTARG